MRKYHKWVGIILLPFILIFCVSGIIMNHRRAVEDINVGRWWMPSDYQIDNLNSGIARGFVMTDSTGCGLVYGSYGVWKCDAGFDNFEEMNDGLPDGLDLRKTARIIRDTSGMMVLCAHRDIYVMREGESVWKKAEIETTGERIADIESANDTLYIMYRSGIQAVALCSLRGNIKDNGEYFVLKNPCGHKDEMSLFKVVWKLHSGELFGMAGRLVVDFVALIMVFLCISGLVYFVFPYLGAWRKIDGLKKCFRFNVREHLRVGKLAFWVMLVVVVSGTCLRPPFMIPLVMANVERPEFVTGGNAFEDKLRGLRYDEANNEWIVSTSDGFMRGEIRGEMRMCENAPSVSPMGINVFRQMSDGRWMVGSFSGMFVWDTQSGEVIDYYTKEKPVKRGMMPIGGAMVSGYAEGTGIGDVVFEYGKGATDASGNKIEIEIPESMKGVGMSLWNAALELHVGRCYTPIIGPLSSLFVFVWGVLITMVLVSGYVVYRRRGGN